LGTTRVGRWAVVGRSGLRVALASLAAFLLFGLGGGCGSNAPDPFLGTWKGADSPMLIVIGESGGEYVVTNFIGTWGHAERDGDALHVWAGDVPKPGREMYLTYQPSTGQLLLTEPEYGPGVHVLFRKTSDSTTIPSPFPGGLGDAFSTP
jgi:hypothetical protein